jgi:hypothetical protein
MTISQKCFGGKNHDYDLLICDHRTGLVKCCRCGHRKKIGDSS